MTCRYLYAIASLTLLLLVIGQACDGTAFNSTLWPQNKAICGVGQQVYAGDLDPAWAPTPQGYLGTPDPTWSRQAFYGCGMPICAPSLVAAQAQFATAAGVPVGDPQLFVVLLGNTGAAIKNAEPFAVAQWVAAGSPCIRKGDGGAKPCKDLGEDCAMGMSGTPEQRCCKPLVCENAIDINADIGRCCKNMQAACASDSECCGSTDPDLNAICRGGTCCAAPGSWCSAPWENQDTLCCPGDVCAQSPDPSDAYWRCQ